MRTRRLFIALLAFSAAGFAACENVKYGAPAPQQPVEKDISVSIKSPGAELTRAVIKDNTESYSVLWEVGNSIGVFTSGDAANTNKQFTIKDGGVTSGVGTFSGTFAGGTTGTVAVYAYAPYDVNAADPKAVSMTMPAAQNMTRKSFDTAAGFMVGVPKSVEVIAKSFEVPDYGFKSLGAMINMSAGISTAYPPTEKVAATEIVSKITLEAPASKVLSGTFTANLLTGAATYPTTGGNTLELTVPANMTIGTLNAWLVSLPFNIATTDELKVTIVAGKYTITKTFTSQEFTFTTSAVEQLYVDIDSDCVIEIDPNAPYHPDAPEATYILGSATEFGDAGNVMHKNSANVFEIYTKLTAGGVYGFTDNVSEGIKYTLVNNELYTGKTGISSTKEGIYYIKVDYASYKVTVEEITSAKYSHPSQNVTKDMVYEGNGVWSVAAIQTTDGTGGDERYRFNIVQNGADYIWGYVNSDSPSKPTTKTGSYYNVVPRVKSGDNWAYSFKCHADYVNSKADLMIYMSPELTNYYHTITLTPIEITTGALTHPEAGEAFTLASTGEQIFSWAASTAAIGTINYEVVFYKDAAGTTEIARKGTNLTSTSLHITNADLNTIAASAGIQPAQSGDIYWTVYTKVGSQGAYAAIRKLSVTRVQTSVAIPTAVYISGVGTEYGDAISGAKAMRKTAEGVFEYYCNMTTGSTYRLTNGKTGTYITYAMNNSSLINGDANSTIATPSATCVYRVTADFNTATVTFVTIGSVWFDRGLARADSSVLTYLGDGQWQYPSHTYANNDERYHFRVSYTIGGDPVGDGGKWDEKWGNFTVNTQQLAAEWNVKVMIGRTNFYDTNPNEADWDYSFKLKARNPGTGTLLLNMNAATPTHSITWQ